MRFRQESHTIARSLTAPGTLSQNRCIDAKELDQLSLARIERHPIGIDHVADADSQVSTPQQSSADSLQTIGLYVTSTCSVAALLTRTVKSIVRSQYRQYLSARKTRYDLKISPKKSRALLLSRDLSGKSRVSNAFC